MFQDILDLILVSAEGAFLQVTVFVGAVLILFNYIDFKTQGAFINLIINTKKFQPVIGALLGLTPGCGGAIFVMPLFVKRNVTFGTVVATLIATMGDAAFIMMTVMPLQYFYVSLISFVAAVITGYLVDWLKLGDNLVASMNLQTTEELKEINEKSNHVAMGSVVGVAVSVNKETYQHIGHEEGDAIDIALHHNSKGHQNPHSFGHRFTHSFYRVYWPVIGVGLVLGVMLLFQMDVNALAIPNLGLYLGVFGTAISILLMVMGKKFLQDDTHEETEMKRMSLKETLIHGAQETAFVGAWVFVAYAIYELGIYTMGGADYATGEEMIKNLMLSAGFISVLVGAAIGLIPGCGPQIIFVALFTRGMIPFAAVLANAISQDGDALFPLLAIDRKSSFLATFITTVPAVIFGVIAYFLEIQLGWFSF